jgi:ABC-type Zn uptake system ZnuABC Zn-binding protein ZnuA
MSLSSPPTLILASLLLAGCIAPAGAPPVDPVAYSSPQALASAPLAEGESLRVVATTSLVADAVRRVAGAAADLTTLMPPGTDPHSYEPTPQDLRAVAEAHLVLANGFGLELFLADLMESSGSSAPVVAVSDGIEPLRAEDGSGGIDPHTWLDPLNVARWVENIKAAVSALDPQRAAEYAERAAAYQADLEALDADLRHQIEDVPAEDRLLVTDHDELGYFAARYGFQVIGAVVPGTSTVAEPSAQEIAALEDAIRGYGVRAIFISQVVTPVLAQRVADDTGIRLVNLHVHSLTGPEGDAPDYLSLMRYNVRAIVFALRR